MILQDEIDGVSVRYATTERGGGVWGNRTGLRVIFDEITRREFPIPITAEALWSWKLLAWRRPSVVESCAQFHLHCTRPFCIKDVEVVVSILRVKVKVKWCWY